MTSRILYTPRQKRALKPRRFNNRAFLAPVLFVLMAGAFVGGIILIRRPEWQIRTVNIQGLSVIPEEDMRSSIERSLKGDIAFIFPRRSMLVARAGGIRTDLESKFPEAATIEIKKQFPATLNIAVRERVLWGIYCNDLDAPVIITCAYLDDTGYAYMPSPVPEGSLILKIRDNRERAELGSYIVERDLAERMRSLASRLEGVAGAEPVEFELRAELPSEIRVVMPEGYRIFFRRDDDFDNAFRVLASVLKEEIKGNRERIVYIDLRFGNKVFYKFR